jgi:hypothetical protein
LCMSGHTSGSLVAVQDEALERITSPPTVARDLRKRRVA